MTSHASIACKIQQVPCAPASHRGHFSAQVKMGPGGRTSGECFVIGSGACQHGRQAPGRIPLHGVGRQFFGLLKSQSFHWK